MQNQNNGNCKTCGRPITSRDKRQQYCDRLCYFGGESKIDYLKRMASAAVPGVCIEWPRSKNEGQYGTIKYEGSTQLVHRVSYKLFVGPLADDECVLHKCDRPACFSPHCLFKGSREDNNRDRDDKGRNAVGMMFPECKLTPEQVQDIRSRWKPHFNAGQLAAEYGITTHHVRYIAKGFSQKHIPFADGTTLAERQIKTQVRLTAQQREEIKRRWKPYSNAGDLAREYGITPAHVFRIATQK